MKYESFTMLDGFVLGADAGIADFPASRYLARGEVEGADRIGKLRMVAPAVAARVAIAVLVIS